MGSTDKDAVLLVITDLSIIWRDHAMHGTASDPMRYLFVCSKFREKHECTHMHGKSHIVKMHILSLG
jgi:hypothetical protein